jgi:hypothetical protein
MLSNRLLRVALLVLAISGCKSDPPSPPPKTPEPAPVVARIQAGRLKVGLNEAGENIVSKDVVFTTPFQAPPIVVVTPLHIDAHPDVFSATVVNPTATGFKVLVHRTDAPVPGWGLDLNIDWVAVDYGGGMAKLLGGP